MADRVINHVVKIPQTQMSGRRRRLVGNAIPHHFARQRSFAPRLLEAATFRSVADLANFDIARWQSCPVRLFTLRKRL